MYFIFFFFSSRRRHTRWTGDWSSDVCSSDLIGKIRRVANDPVRIGRDQQRSHVDAVVEFRQALRERGVGLQRQFHERPDRKSTRLNSSHPSISYAVFCLKKKKKGNSIIVYSH